MSATNLSFRAPEGLLVLIKSRDRKGVNYPGAVAKRDLERWYALMGDAISEVQLTPAEVVVLAYYASTFDGEPNHWNVAGSAIALQGRQIGLSEEFSASRDTLAKKMSTWSTAAVYAAWDAVERYQVLALRNRADSGDLTFGMALHRIGLHTYGLSGDELAHVERMTAVPADLLPGEYLNAREDDDG